jgi:hypothetical protein
MAFSEGGYTSPVRAAVLGGTAVEFDDDRIWLGGHAVTCIKGSLKV